MANQGFKVLDSDLHIMEPVDLYEKFIDPQYKPFAPRLTAMPEKLSGDGSLVMDWHVKPRASLYHDREVQLNANRRMHEATTSMREQGYNAVSQLEAMDIEGVDVAVLFPTLCLNLPNSYDNVDPGLAAAMSRAYNNWLYEFCQTDPKRMKVAALIPAHDVHEAVKETERAVTKLGALAVFLQPGIVNNRPWHSRYFDPLWATLEELDIPICWHPEADDFLQEPEFANNKLMRHAYANPTEVMRAMISMICGGVFDNFPRLRAAFLEANCGWAPFWVSRMEREYKRYGPWEGPLELAPRDYYKRNCWVNVEADEAEAKMVVEALGDDNIVFSTDYPHGDSEFPTSVNEFLKQPLSRETKSKILWNNCARLYNIS